MSQQHSEYAIGDFDGTFIDRFGLSPSKINTLPFGEAPPGTVKFYEARQHPDGSWTFRFQYRPEGWDEDGKPSTAPRMIRT